VEESSTRERSLQETIERIGFQMEESEKREHKLQKTVERVGFEAGAY
jgi:hypothetical protein